MPAPVTDLSGGQAQGSPGQAPLDGGLPTQAGVG